jgi:hypothetical protein
MGWAGLGWSGEPVSEEAAIHGSAAWYDVLCPAPPAHKQGVQPAEGWFSAVLVRVCPTCRQGVQPADGELGAAQPHLHPGEGECWHVHAHVQARKHRITAITSSLVDAAHGVSDGPCSCHEPLQDRCCRRRPSQVLDMRNEQIQVMQESKEVRGTLSHNGFSRAAFCTALRTGYACSTRARLWNRPSRLQHKDRAQLTEGGAEARPAALRAGQLSGFPRTRWISSCLSRTIPCRAP